MCIKITQFSYTYNLMENICCFFVDNFQFAMRHKTGKFTRCLHNILSKVPTRRIATATTK